MSTPVALPAPRVFRLPRVRFKRPRWPKGSRLMLVMAVANLLLATLWLAQLLTGTGDGPLPALVAFNGAVGAWNGWLWWRSRDDDDGPRAT